ncbi:MAG: YhdH/YhfP family quinone oxidoreductase [Halioglobus sp.]|nr:YhdH/YhfP family quinone oxidoreductase [Halioglobus sp.]
MATYKALFVQRLEDGNFKRSIELRETTDLPDNELLIRVQYSSLNFKDAMSAHGNKGVTREFPHQPGIDAAGVVEDSRSPDFQVGDKVLVTGYDLGMNTAGGLGQYIRVPAAWTLRCPRGLNPKRSMQFGTAGLTAQLCINKLQKMGVTPDKGPILVTGATGGVGCIAVALLAHAGYDVVASSGKAEQSNLLRSLGAVETINRAEFSEPNPRPLLKERFAGAIDVVGGDTLANVIKSIASGGSVACCGLVQAPNFQGSVLPFILRGVNLLGVDSVEISLEEKLGAWKKLARCAGLDTVASLNTSITLKQVPQALETLFAGGTVGHTMVRLGR